MKKILVLNCGSSSIKYTLFDGQYTRIVEGVIERIGEDASFVHWKGKHQLKGKCHVKSHAEGLMHMFRLLHDSQWGAIKRTDEISVVGHRVVHGGYMAKTVLATTHNLEYLKSFEDLAPLHNPHNILGITECKRIMPHVPQVMVFDTAFHQTMPPKAYMYGFPYYFYDKYGVRRYGFHGTSHKYVTQRAASILGKKRPNLITCHLGAGASIAAVKRGISVDTSMGMTPLEGLMMGTRTGDVDPAILQYVARKYGLGYDEIFNIMNKQSGILGISGVSKDVRVVESRAKQGDRRCQLALDMFCYRAAKYIGAYAVALGSIDAIVFTGGIGENASNIRKEICSYLKIIGVALDARKNRAAVGREAVISAKRSKVRVLVIPTDEELMIAKEAVEMLRRGSVSDE